MIENKKAMPTGKQGFTLVELLLAIAILVMLSGAILVSISSQREKARTTRMLSEVSAVMQPIYMCLADGGNIISPNATSGGPAVSICSLSVAYGTWPKTSDIGFGVYSASNATGFGGNGWYIKTDSASARICCNSHTLSCHSLASAATCDKDTP